MSFRSISRLGHSVTWFACLGAILLHASHCSAQEPISLEGKVVDNLTSAPMPFAQLSVAKSTLGTVTNEEGRFQLKIPDSFRNDSLFIAFLGYETVREKIEKLSGSQVEIRLKPKVMNLSEVEIVGLTPQEVIRRAVANIPSNYGDDSVMLTAFVRSQKFVRNRLAEFTEAIIRNLKTGYRPERKGERGRNNRGSNIPELVKGRVVSDTTLVKAMGDVGEKAGCLGCNFMSDCVEYPERTILDQDVFKYYTLEMKEIENPEGGKIYHIRYDQSVKNQVLYQGELFIDGTTFAVIKMTLKPSYRAYDHYEKGKYRRTYTIFGTAGWVAEMPLLSRTVCYAKREGFWCLSLIQEEQWVSFLLPATGQKARMGYKNDVVVTEVTRDPSSIRNFRGDRSKGMNQRWDQLVGQPDGDFWMGFNYLPIEEKLKNEVGEIKRSGY